MLHIYGTKDENSLPFLSQLFAQTCGLKALPEIAYTETGKPFFPTLPGLHFSLTHSGSYLLCALCSTPVGLDAERIRPRADKLPRYAFTEQEYARYLSLGEHWPAFYALWTKKEAWVKFTGEGLGKALRIPPPEEGLHYHSYYLADLVVTVCSTEFPPPKILWLGGTQKENTNG